MLVNIEEVRKASSTFLAMKENGEGTAAERTCGTQQKREV